VFTYLLTFTFQEVVLLSGVGGGTWVSFSPGWSFAPPWAPLGEAPGGGRAGHHGMRGAPSA
jgi:hypothetical protein